MLWPLFGTYLCRLLAFSVPPQGLEPWTPTLRVSCSTNWAKEAFAGANVGCFFYFCKKKIFFLRKNAEEGFETEFCFFYLVYILNRILFKLYGCIDWLPNYYVSRFIISVHPSRWWKKRRLRAKNHFFGGFFVGTNIWILNVRYSIYCDFWFAFFVEKLS